MVRPVFPEIRAGCASIRRKSNQDRNRSGNKCSNSVHPVISIVHSAENLKDPQTGKFSRADNVASIRSFAIKVQVLHGIDLYIPAKTTCQHTSRPVVQITVNGSSMQSCIAAQHARNHSTWKRHEFKFCVSPHDQDQKHVQFTSLEKKNSAAISMYVSLVCIPCSCTAKSQDKSVKQIAIGEVGELQFSTRHGESFEITQFFPVIRHLQQSSQSLDVLLPAGKIKLWICVAAEKVGIDRIVAQSEILTNCPLKVSLPTNFEETLQLKRKQLKATILPEDKSQNHSNLQVVESDLSASMELLRDITIETLPDHIRANELNLKGQVGEGIHSCVSRGTLHCKSDGFVLQVAVKEFRHKHAIPPVNVLRAFQQEYRILECCRSHNGCEYIVNLLGVIVKPRLVLLMEFLSHGSLAQCLLDEVVWSQMTMQKKAAIGLQIARGISWLHKHDMIHRDIKCYNILIDGNFNEPNLVVKVGDLGSAIMRLQHEPLLLEKIGSSGYTAPEVFTHLGYDNKIDVWSFGIVLWELMSNSLRDRVNPFAGLTEEDFVMKVQGGCRPVFAHAHQLSVRFIVEKCWILDPLQRPNMIEVVKELETLCAEL